jgi:hypothetical protein
MIEKEIKDALLGVLRKNGIPKMLDFSVKKDTVKRPYKAGGLGNEQKISDLPSHEAVFQILTIRLVYAEPEES